jgi:hypothetical protein
MLQEPPRLYTRKVIELGSVCNWAREQKRIAECWRHLLGSVKCEVLAAVTMTFTVFWDVTPYSLIG